MSYGTSTGSTPRTKTVDSPDKKPDVQSKTEYRVRCPSCEFSKRYHTHAGAISHQQRNPCPNCDRMLGVSEVAVRYPADALEAAEAVADAEATRRELSVDGPAPSTREILRAMGRDTDGYPFVDGPNDLDAHEAARQLLQEGPA